MDNPHHKGTMGNCGEIFCSSIPPSMNKFGSFIEEDEHVVVTPVSSDLGEGVMSSKEEIDIEMETRIPEENGFLLPNILQHLDYDPENNLKSTEEGQRQVMDAYFPVETEVKESLISHSGGNGRMDAHQVREPMQHSPPRYRVRESVEGTMLMARSIGRNDD